MSKLEEVFEPEWSGLLIRPDPVSRYTAILGHNGKPVERPDSAMRESHHWGEIVRRGPDADPDLEVGRRVFFALQAGHEMKMKTDKLILIPAEEALLLEGGRGLGWPRRRGQPRTGRRLAPRGSNLLVKQEEASRRIGSVLVPDTVWDVGRPNTGQVIARGPRAPAAYQVKARVVYGIYSGQEPEDGVVLLSPSQVLALISGKSGIENAGTEKFLQPPPGRLLVQRLDTPIERGRIHIPDGVSTATRSHEARVLRSAAPRPRRFQEGEVVFLGPSVTRGFAAGPLADEKYYCCTEGEILGHVAGELAAVEVAPDLGAHQRALLAERPFDNRYNEGDRAAPQ